MIIINKMEDTRMNLHDCLIGLASSLATGEVWVTLVTAEYIFLFLLKHQHEQSFNKFSCLKDTHL